MSLTSTPTAPEAAFCDLLARRPDLGVAALVLASENRRLSETAGPGARSVRKRLAFFSSSPQRAPPQQRWTQT